MYLSEMAWPDLDPAHRLLAIPLGATEQHGPHLPFTVDTEIAVELCARLASCWERVVIAPAVAYGSSGEHAAFPGTLSVGQKALELLLIELVRSADAFAGVVLVCAHGGNASVLRRVVSRLRGEGRRTLAWSPSGRDDDSHAGRIETSAMLALRPSGVHKGRLAPGTTTPLPELMDHLRRDGVGAVSPTGVLGDPTGASAEEGERLLDGWARDLVAAMQAWLAG